MALGTAALIAAGIGSAAAASGSSILNTWLNAKYQREENALDRAQAEYLTKLQQTNALEQMSRANEYNLNYIDKQQAFEREMSNTAYRRAVVDMEAAGLNPASLMGSSLAAASTPSSGLAHASAAGAGVVSGGHGSNHLGANINFGDKALSDAISFMLAKDKDAKDYVSKSIVNSAKNYNYISSVDDYVAKEAAAAKKKAFEDQLRQWEYYKTGK